MKTKCYICGERIESNSFIADIQVNVWNLAKDKGEEVRDGTICNFFEKEICSYCCKRINSIMEKIKETNK